MAETRQKKKVTTEKTRGKIGSSKVRLMLRCAFKFSA